MKYLITGGTGFLGENLIRHIISREKNYDITCTYNRSCDHLNDLNIKFIKCDISISEQVNGLLSDFDCIIHLAAVVKHSNKDVEDMISINLGGTQNIINLVKKIQDTFTKKVRLLVASSVGTVACFDNKNDVADENSSYSFISSKFPYYKSKIDAEQLCLKAISEDNLEIIMIRPPVIYGPLDSLGRATHRIKKFLANNLVLYTQGTIPICDVRDLSKFMYSLIYADSPRPIYNIDGHPITVYEFYNMLEVLSEKKKVKIYIPLYPTYYILQLLDFILKPFCIKLPDIVELEMGSSFWTSNSLYTKSFFDTPLCKTLSDTINVYNN